MHSFILSFFDPYFAKRFRNLFLAGLQCPGSAVEQAATTGRCISHPRAFPCGDGTTCQCVAALFQLCNAPVTTSWQKGAQVKLFLHNPFTFYERNVS